MVRVGYRVDVCSKDQGKVGEVFVELLSTCWAIVYHDGSSLECADRVLKALCVYSGGDCVIFTCKGFTLVFVRRDAIAEILKLPMRTADKLVYVELGDFTDKCCFKHKVYVAAGTVEEAARGMVEDFLVECCGETGGGDDVAKHNS
jgi:hypothetical protein